MNDRTPGYYAVIPATVRYDDGIPANAKLLYGEISALVGAEGYCYAKNTYFASLYQLSERTISALISKLQEAGYITVELERDDTGQVTARKLRLILSAAGAQPLEENFYTPRKNLREGIEENFQYTNTSNTNIEKENKKRKKRTPAPLAEDFDPMLCFKEWILKLFPNEPPQRKNDLYYALARFNENRLDMKKPIRTKATVTSLFHRLQRITDNAGDPLALMIEVLDTATLNRWQSVYPPKDASSGGQPKGGRVYECL